MSIVVLCPTRGRPDSAAEMVESFRATTVRLDTSLVLVVDVDDPMLVMYPRSWSLGLPEKPTIMVLGHDQTGDLVKATNTAAGRVWDDADIIGHVGDDHRFRTHGWDRRVTDALTTPGVAYADDGYWHEALCTSWFVSSSIPRALGWLALPTARHYAIDDAWIHIGRALDSLRYLPDVLIEHPSPKLRPKGPSKAADREALALWRSGQMAHDIASVQRALS